MNYGNYAPFYRSGYFNPMQPQNPNIPNMMENQNQFVQPYQMPVQQPQMSPTPMSGTSSNDIIWVQGLEGAKSYLVAPNNTVTLWDSENPTIYVKSADVNGVPSMRILDFTERTANVPKTPENHVCQCGDKFASKEDMTALQGKYNDILNRLTDVEEKYNSLTAKATKSKKPEADENA